MFSIQDCQSPNIPTDSSSLAGDSDEFQDKRVLKLLSCRKLIDQVRQLERHCGTQ